MNRHEYNFDLWCQTATEKIRYRPDRKAVAAELMAHLEDHRDALMERGLSQKEAERKAVTAMGSAQEIAARVQTVNPVYFDVLPLSLEEIFIYELGGVNYEVKNIIL